MDKPLTQIQRFWKLAEERKLCGHDQLLYLRLLHEFNAAHFPAELELTNGELMERLNLHEGSGAPLSERTFKNMKARLKKKQFIDFKHGKRGTVYRLIAFYEEEAPRPAKPLGSEVLAVWDECGGVTPNGFVASELLKRAEVHGAGFIIDAIRDARKACQYPRMNYLYFEKFLEGRLKRKGGGQDVRKTWGGTEQYAGLLDGDVPAEYAVR